MHLAQIATGYRSDRSGYRFLSLSSITDDHYIRKLGALGYQRYGDVALSPVNDPCLLKPDIGYLQGLTVYRTDREITALVGGGPFFGLQVRHGSPADRLSARIRYIPMHRRAYVLCI